MKQGPSALFIFQSTRIQWKIVDKTLAVVNSPIIIDNDVPIQ